MNLTDESRVWLDHVIDNFICQDRQERFRRLLLSEKGVETFRKELCHFQKNLRVERAMPPAKDGWWTQLADQFSPDAIFVFGRHRCEAMPFRQAKEGVGICSFVIDMRRRFAVYVGDCGDDLVFLSPATPSLSR